MKGIRELWNGLRGPSVPSPRATLEAHLTAYVERFAAESPANAARKGGLPVRGPQGQYRVVVQSAMWRVEAHHQQQDGFAVCVPGDNLVALAEQEAQEVRANLVAAGLLRVGNEPHYRLRGLGSGPSGLRRAADAIESVLGALARVAGRSYSVAIEKEPVPNPGAMLDSIRSLVSAKDETSRRRVYEGLVNGAFYLPLRPVRGEAVDAGPVGLEVDPWPEDLAGNPVWAVCTDTGALDDLRDERHPYLVISGVHLIGAARARRLGALKINPRSKVGGELYGGELLAIARHLERIEVLPALN